MLRDHQIMPGLQLQRQLCMYTCTIRIVGSIDDARCKPARFEGFSAQCLGVKERTHSVWVWCHDGWTLYHACNIVTFMAKWHWNGPSDVTMMILMIGQIGSRYTCTY
jgi:hypothetical protein